MTGGGRFVMHQYQWKADIAFENSFQYAHPYAVPTSIGMTLVKVTVRRMATITWLGRISFFSAPQTKSESICFNVSPGIFNPNRRQGVR